MAVVYIGLGANLGERERTISTAVERMASLPLTQLLRVSRMVETEPVGGPPDQPRYVNGVAVIETGQTPEELLRSVQEIERNLGRVRIEKWGPRTIDLDILFFDDIAIETPELTVPHPLIERRRFVLEPLCEVAPDLRHPVSGQTVRELLGALSEDAGA